MNWGSEPSSKKVEYNDFKSRQLYFQSCDTSIEPLKPLKHTFSSDISLKPVERRAFGVLKDQ